MKKQLFFSLCLSILTSLVSAQYYLGPSGTGNPNNVNPEDLEYPYGGGLPSGWAVVHTGSAITPQWSTVQSLPFAFQFNGSAVSTFKVSTSGVLTFTTTASAVPSYSNAALPHSSIPAQSVCIWGLAGKSSNDYIVTKTFGTAPYRQFWVMFSAYSVPTIVTNHYTFWSIVLEETSNAIYIVDQRTSPGTNMTLTAGVQLATGNALMIPGSPSLNRLAGDNPAKADNVYYTFMPGTLPALDLKGEELLLDNYLNVNNGPYDIKLVVENLGTDTVHQLDFNYLNSANLKTVASIGGLNIAPGATDTLVHPIQWSPMAGTTTVKAWAELLNGLADQNLLNDTAFKTVTILQNAPVRVPLIESFTSSTSLQSADVNEQIEDALDQYNGQAVHIKYPMNWPGTGDPYYTTEGGARRQFYNVSSLPNLQIDGADWSSYGSAVNDSILGVAAQKTGLVNLSATFYVSNKTVCATAEYTPLVNLGSQNVVLHMAIYEKTSTQNVKSSGETVFYNIMKKMMPNNGGTTLTNFSANNTQSTSQCFTFVGNYQLPANATQPVNLNTNHTIENFANVGVVVWLQDVSTKQVIQAAEALSTIGLSEFETEITAEIFPNPAQNQLFVALSIPMEELVALTLTNLTGQTILHEQHKVGVGQTVLPVALPSLPKGVYMLKLNFGRTQLVKKVMIE